MVKRVFVWRVLFWGFCFPEEREKAHFLFLKNPWLGGRLYSFKSPFKLEYFFEAMGNIFHFVPRSGMYSLILAMANIYEVFCTCISC